MISPEAMISLRDEIVRFCTMISKLRLGCGIFEYSFARSKRTYKRNLPIRRRNTSRKAARKASVELDGKYKRLRRLGAKLAHKAQWYK